MTNPTQNRAISKYSAIVNGEKTGLAGCGKACTGCLRGDPMLEKILDLALMGDKNPTNCKIYVPYQPERHH